MREGNKYTECGELSQVNSYPLDALQIRWNIRYLRLITGFRQGSVEIGDVCLDSFAFCISSNHVCARYPVGVEILKSGIVDMIWSCAREKSVFVLH
jgi:hypothetical protein